MAKKAKTPACCTCGSRKTRPDRSVDKDGHNRCSRTCASWASDNTPLLCPNHR